MHEVTPQVHLLLKPEDEAGTPARFMKRVAARQTRYVNRLQDRSGTLWGSR